MKLHPARRRLLRYIPALDAVCTTRASHRHRLRRRLGMVALALISFAPSLRAQSTTRIPAPTESSLSPVRQAHALSVSGNLAAAEAALVATVPGAAGTAQWNQYCGRLLTRLALMLGASRDFAAQRQAASRALAYIAAAEAQTSHQPTVSNLRLTAGMLYERCLHDEAAARESYRRSVAASARNTLAAGALARIDRNEERDRARRISPQPRI